MADYFSFEDVMGQLELSEEDLKRMVSEGELRAFRDENKMKFRKEDVENLKKGRITEPTIILPSTPGAGTTEETVLDLDIGNETSALADTSIDDGRSGGPVAEFSETDLTLSEDTGVGSETEETFIEEESETGLTTEPLKLADEASEETLEAEAVGEELAEVGAGAAGKTRATRMSRRVTSSVPMAVEEEIERKRPHWIWTILLFLTVGTGIFSGFFFYDLARLETGKADQPLGITAGVAKYILDSAWGDPEYTKFHEKEYPGKRPPINEEIDKHGFIVPIDWYTGPSFEKPDAIQRQTNQ